MKDKNNASLLKSLEQLPTSDLDAMLRSKLGSEPPDEQAIQLILQVLRKREEDFPLVYNPQIGKAWDTYQKKTAQDSLILKEPLIKVAAILILCSVLLFTLPQKAQAENIFSRIAAWTDNVFELFAQWNQDHAPQEYVFQTKHPGMLELYNAVTELGITAPVVPMWFEDGYILEHCNTIVTPTYSKVIAYFSSGENEAAFELNIHSDSIPREFQKNEANVETHESNGIIHYIFRNNDLWTVVWMRDNLECSISIECQEEVVYQILDSIYATED